MQESNPQYSGTIVTSAKFNVLQWLSRIFYKHSGRASELIISTPTNEHSVFSRVFPERFLKIHLNIHINREIFTESSTRLLFAIEKSMKAQATPSVGVGVDLRRDGRLEVVLQSRLTRLPTQTI